MKKTTVAIFGGGVSGLTVAHELSKFPDSYDVTIYETKSDVGGLARSGRDSDGCATEYCWRVFFGFYSNVLRIMSEIPITVKDEMSSANLQGTVLDNLTQYHHENIEDKGLSWKDQLIGIYNILYGFVSCDKRLTELDNLTWWDALGSSSSSNLFRCVGGWLGMDRLKGSYNSVIKVGMEMQMFPAYVSSDYRDFVTKKPTSEAWFDPWMALLRSRKVRFSMNTSLQSIAVDSNGERVTSAVISNQDGSLDTVLADHYILAIPVEVLASLVESNQALNQGSLSNVPRLRDSCLHVQLSFQVWFDRPVSLGVPGTQDKNAFLVVSSPWDLIVLSYDKAFTETVLCSQIPAAKGGWSVAACTAYIPGIVYGKPMLECTYDEIIIELWAQLMNSPKLVALVKDNNGFDLTEDKVLKWSPMWPTYSNDGKGHLQTMEPKFTNNAGSLALRPGIRTHLVNLFVSTGYAKETIDIFSMEAAAISGIEVSKIIEERSVVPVLSNRPILFSPFRKIDQVFHYLGMPNFNLILFPAIFLLLLVLLIYWIIR